MPVVHHAVPRLQRQRVGAARRRRGSPRAPVDLARYDLDDGHTLQPLGAGASTDIGGRDTPSSTTTRCGWSRSGLPAGLEARTALQPSGQHLLQLQRVGGDQTAAAGAVRRCPGPGRAAATSPTPTAAPRPGRSRRRSPGPRGSAARRASRPRRGPCERTDCRLTADRHVVEGAQRDGHRQVRPACRARRGTAASPRR